MKGLKNIWLFAIAAAMVAGCGLDSYDECPDDPNRDEAGICGCGSKFADDLDTDKDGTPDCHDECPTDPDKVKPGNCGCGQKDLDANQNGIVDCLEEANKPEDKCPDDPDKTEPGECGCGKPEVSGCGEAVDQCPDDPDKTEPGECGCGKPEVAGCGEAVDQCPDDPDKTEPGECGCGNPEVEGCGEITIVDNCPDDPNKNDAGVCGCGVADDDSDGDGVYDCNDVCKDDPYKSEAEGVCGCGVSDDDSDGDGTPDCKDSCPADPDKTAAGECGCGVKEVAGCGKFDADGDEISDDEDPCPTNPDTTLTAKDCKVVNEIDRTATIRHAFDLYTLAESLKKDTTHDKQWKITVTNDLNFGYVNMNGLAEKAGMEALLTDVEDGDCTIKSPAITMVNSVFDGKGKTITAVYKDKSCSLDNALFETVSTKRTMSIPKDVAATTVDDIKLRMDVKGAAHALFANEIEGNVTASNISVKGKLTTTATENVGGLTGHLNGNSFQSSYWESTLNNCYTEDVSIEAPNADYVGGLIGYLQRGNVYMKTTTRVTSVVGKDRVGGVFGDVTAGDQGRTTLGSMEGSTIQSIVGTVSGHSFVGGFAGTTNIGGLDNMRSRVTNVKATGDYVGGLAGSLSTRSKNGGFVSNTTSRIDTIDAPNSSSVGGLVGTGISSCEAVLSQIGSISGKSNVGGLLGETNDFSVTLKMVQSRVDKVSGEENVGGLFGSAGSDNLELISIFHSSSFANVYAKNTNAIGGVAGKITTRSENKTEIGWPTFVTAAALYKSSDSSRIHAPTITPKLEGYIPSNAMQYIYWYSSGNKSEKALLTASSTIKLFNTDAVNYASHQLTSDNLDTIITRENSKATNTYADVTWVKTDFTLGGSKVSLPLVTVKNLSLPE